MRTLGIVPTEIRLTGGGARSGVWRQLCADVFGCRVTTLAESEGAALGSAIQALAASETSHSVNEWSGKLVQVNPQETTEPRGNPSFDYFGAMEKQVSLTGALVERGFYKSRVGFIVQ